MGGCGPRAVPAVRHYAERSISKGDASWLPQRIPIRGRKRRSAGASGCIVFWLALIVFIGSVGTLGYLFYTYWQGQNEYEEIASRVR